MLTSNSFRQGRSATGEMLDEWYTELEAGAEVLVLGDGAAPSQRHLHQANEVVANLGCLLQKAVDLLVAFMKDEGTWELQTIDCGLEAQRQECEFLLRLAFEQSGNVWEYGYTYFDVGFSVQNGAHPSDKMGRAVKLVIGFH